MTLQIKTGWEQVTIEDFMQITSAINDSSVNELEKKIHILAVLAGVEESAFNDYPISEVHKLFKQIDWIYTEPKGNIQDYYIIGERKYKLIKQVKDLNAAQFIDLSSYTKDPDLVLENIDKICAVLLLPVKSIPLKKRLLNKVISGIKNKKFQSHLRKQGIKVFTEPTETYMETPIQETEENIFNRMMISDALGISVFFCLLSNSFINHIQACLESETMKQLKLISPMLKTAQEKSMMAKILEKAETGFSQNGIG